jgi:TonB-linked SusC/RagA family outer membrane protein
MKISFFISLCCIINLSAGNISSQTLTINFKNTPVKEIFKAIENQSSYRFFYNDELSDVNRLVSIDVVNSDINILLSQVLDKTRTSFKVLENNLIVIAPVENLKQIKVSGIVKDEQTGEVMPGVNITILGTTMGVVTDINGKYSIELTNAEASLVFSFIGYVPQTIKYAGQASIDIILAPDIKNLDEVVVVGYGTQKKSDVTGAMIRVSEKELSARPVTNVIEAMQGKAAGVDITSNERPGEMGAVTIRGIRSLTASSNPLYVVDGIPLMSSTGISTAGGNMNTSGIETLNPADIESIDVLKDASATAIYGARGANGVILITTKKGKTGKMSINYSSSITFENIQDRTKMMNADEYLTWRRWGYYYSDKTKYPRGDEPNRAKDSIMFTANKDMNAWNNILKGWVNDSTWDGSRVKTTDWTGMVVQTGVTQEHNLSVSGGTEKMKAYASFGYLNTRGTQKGQDYTRYTSKVSLDLNPVKWFEMGASISPTYSIQQFGMSTTGGQATGPNSIYAAAINNLPYAVPYDTLGKRITYPGGDDVIKTVVDEWKYSENQRRTLRILGSIYTQINILPGLKYRVNFGPDFRKYMNGVYIDAMSVSRTGSPNLASLRNENNFNWTLDNLLYYDKKIGKHSFGATFLQSSSAYSYDFSYMRALNIPVSSQKWNALNKNYITALDDWNSDLVEGSGMSWMGRLNYGFAEKYLLTVSGRWDGASQLADGHKWAFFPSAALAWRADQEEWLKDVSWISQLKLRLGVGTTGNSALNPYQTKGAIVALYYPYGSSATQGYAPSESLITGGGVPMANPNLGWEITTQYNFGIDFSILKGRIFGVIDLYTSKTKDLLLQMTLPALTGYPNTYANVGETKNKGIDITLNTINVKTRNFSWETSLNAAWSKEVVSLANGKSDDIANNWFIGQPVGVIYGYESNGIWKEKDSLEMRRFNRNGHSFQVGMSRPVDQNGDSVINPNYDRKIIGNTRPQWTIGLTNTFTYKNFELSIFIYGRLGYTVNTGGEWQGGRYVQRSINYYNENNKESEYQKPIYNIAGGDPYYSILGYRNGSFIKIRYINLGYTLPLSICKKLGMQSMKIYVQAKNPGMIYSNIDWLDMDTGVSTWNRGYVFGVNVGF